MILYKTGYGVKLIEPVEVEKYTKNSMWMKSDLYGLIKRYYRHTTYGHYWDTLDEAKQHLTEKYEQKIKLAENQIKEAKYNLEALSKY